MAIPAVFPRIRRASTRPDFVNGDPFAISRSAPTRTWTEIRRNLAKTPSRRSFAQDLQSQIGLCRPIELAVVEAPASGETAHCAATVLDHHGGHLQVGLLLEFQGWWTVV